MKNHNHTKTDIARFKNIFSLFKGIVSHLEMFIDEDIQEEDKIFSSKRWKNSAPYFVEIVQSYSVLRKR